MTGTCESDLPWPVLNFVLRWAARLGKSDAPLPNFDPTGPARRAHANTPEDFTHFGWLITNTIRPVAPHRTRMVELTAAALDDVFAGLSLRKQIADGIGADVWCICAHTAIDLAARSDGWTAEGLLDVLDTFIDATRAETDPDLRCSWTFDVVDRFHRDRGVQPVDIIDFLAVTV